MLSAAFLGVLVFGRFADVAGRKRVYWLVAVIMIAGGAGIGAVAVILGADRIPLPARVRGRR
jgi:MFS family permease